MLKKILTRLVGLLLLVTLVASAWVALNSFDAAGFDDYGILGRVRPADPGNAAYQMLSGITRYAEVDVTAKHWQTVRVHLLRGGYDAGFVEPLLREQAAALDVVEQVAAAPALGFPELRDIESDLPEYTRYTAAADLMLLRALYWEKQHDSVRALRDLETVLKFARKIRSASRSYLIGYLIGLSIQDRAVYHAAGMLAEAELSEGDRARLIQLLGRFDDLGADGFDQVMYEEYLFVIHLLDALAEQAASEDLAGLFWPEASPLPDFLLGVLKNYLLHPNRSKTLQAEYFVDLATQARGGCQRLDLPRLTAVPGWRELLTRNAFGRHRHDFSGYFQRRCRSAFLLRATRFLVARASGAAGAELRAHPPQDPFADGPLRVSANGTVIYSVGADGQDSGGGAGPAALREYCQTGEPCLTEPALPADFARLRKVRVEELR